jgi:hypothetical protein
VINPPAPSFIGDIMLKHPIRTGGLMRCCLAHLYEDCPDKPEPGEFVKCRYCPDTRIKFNGEEWEWDREHAMKKESAG